MALVQNTAGTVLKGSTKHAPVDVAELYRANLANDRIDGGLKGERGARKARLRVMAARERKKHEGPRGDETDAILTVIAIAEKEKWTGTDLIERVAIFMIEFQTRTGAVAGELTKALEIDMRTPQFKALVVEWFGQQALTEQVDNIENINKIFKSNTS